MKKLCIALALLLSLSITNAKADVLDFDNIDLMDSVSVVSTFDIFDVSGFALIDVDFQPGTGYEFGNFSPENSVFNNNAQTMTFSITGGGQFNVDGAYFAGGWRDNLSVLAIGIDSLGNISDTKLFNVDSNAPTWVDIDFGAVDSFVLSSFGGVDAGYGGGPNDTHFVMDNFTFSVVPEPTSACCLSLLMLGGLIRRRK